jgi:hypothetical protein
MVVTNKKKSKHKATKENSHHSLWLHKTPNTIKKHSTKLADPFSKTGSSPLTTFSIT